MGDYLKSISIEKIKLIIWDLDETFWHGTLSEENIFLPDKNYHLIKKLTDVGIVNSICSKNDFDECRNKLSSLKVWDYFVFPSISWDAKGSRVKEIVSSMSLREQNVLFIDDNIHNLEEVRFFLPNIYLAEPVVIEDLVAQLNDISVDNPDHSRLEHYKILEKKHEEKKHSSSNIDFLRDSKIRVELKSDCLSQAERLYELSQRTNQLNYTKIRCSYNEFIETLNDNKKDTAYIEARDKFGDYGIVGFYSFVDGNLEHFFFSCRSMGMGVEQYVYEYLNFPEIKVVGDVTIPLIKNYKVDWINATDNGKYQNKNIDLVDFKIIAKGPCDISQTMTYFEGKNNVASEFTYVGSKGNSIESHNHTYGILGAKKYSEKLKKEMIDSLIFLDEKVFDTSLFSDDFDVFIYSLHTDVNLGLYKRKGTNDQIVAFGEYAYPMTDPSNWDGYVTGRIFNAGVKFSYNFLSKFSEDYEFLGNITVDDFIENLKEIRSYLPEKSLMIIINGSETPYLRNKSFSYENRHFLHKKYNDALRSLSTDFENLIMLDVNKYIENQSSFTDNINHYKRRIYYQIASEILLIAKNKKGLELCRSGISRLYRQLFSDSCKSIVRKIIN